MTRYLVCMFFVVTAGSAATEPGGKVRCVGGTLAAFKSGLKGTVRTADQDAFVFVTPTSTLRIPYAKIDTIEYGQEVSRRVLLSWVISPLFLLLKARAHFITLGFTDETGKHQAIVLRVDKRLIRSELSALEARTGRMVEYQDGEARKFHRG